MNVVRSGNSWRRLGLFSAMSALGLVAVVFFVNCAGAPVNAQAAPTPVAVLQATAVPPTPTTAPVSNSNNSAGGARVTGNFISANQAAIAFSVPGRIVELKVKEGDAVKKGDALASLDTSILELQIAQATAAVNSAKTSVSLAQARLKQTQTPANQETQIAAAAAVKAAQANFARVSQGPTADDLTVAKANVDRAKAAVDQAQAQYDRAGGATNPVSELLPTALGLQQATINYQAALAGYNLAKNHPTIAELAGAAAQLAQAQSLVAQLTPTPENLAIAQAGVDQAQSGVDQAQAALNLAQANLTNSTINAPFDGTVVLTGPKVGEYVNPGTTIVTLADLSKMQVIANVDEITLGGLKVGQGATLLIDALGDQTLKAHISKIGLWATSSGGVTSVPVTLDVDGTAANIYPGLSTTVQFDAQ
jgi:multidrug resistance efflux pump